MGKRIFFFLATAVILGGIFLYQGFDQERGGEMAPPGEGRTKINREGDVEAVVTFLSEDQGTPPAELTFKVELKSAGYDLTDYNPAETATLTNARREKLSTGFMWKEEEAGRDYLKGLLWIANKRPDGKPFWEKDMGSLTLLLQDLGEKKEREFHWVFPLPSQAKLPLYPKISPGCSPSSCTSSGAIIFFPPGNCTRSTCRVPCPV